jgi:hypothetical protein
MRCYCEHPEERIVKLGNSLGTQENTRRIKKFHETRTDAYFLDLLLTSIAG